jgi:hypothetical protein
LSKKWDEWHTAVLNAISIKRPPQASHLFVARAWNFQRSHFQRPSRINLYNLSGAGMYFMGNKDAYDAIHALDGHIDWPSAQNEIVESLQKVYREKHFDGWDWKSIRLKHIR